MPIYIGMKSSELEWSKKMASILDAILVLCLLVMGNTQILIVSCPNEVVLLHCTLIGSYFELLLVI